MKTMKLFTVIVMTSVFALTANATTVQSVINDETLETAQPLKVAGERSDETVPQYPGGTKAMYDFLFSNLKFPAADVKKGVSGIVIARFTVKKDGSLANIEVIKHGTPSMDKEVVRVLKKMPKWTPGKKNGVPVAVSVSVPINFNHK